MWDSNLKWLSRDEDELVGKNVLQEAEVAEQHFCEQREKAMFSPLKPPCLEKHPWFVIPTSLRGSGGVDGCCKDGGTYENMHALIPVGGQHQNACCCSDHTFLRADGMFPLSLFLLNQVNASCFTANYRMMNVHRRRHHIWMRGSIWTKQWRRQSQPRNFSQCWLLTCGYMHKSHTCETQFRGGPIRISYLQCNNPLNIS